MNSGFQIPEFQISEFQIEFQEFRNSQYFRIPSACGGGGVVCEGCGVGGSTLHH